CIDTVARSKSKDRLEKTESSCLEPYCKRDAIPGKKTCPQCFFKRRDSKERTKATKPLAETAWEQHKGRAKWKFGPGTWLLLEAFTALMYPDGPDGPRASCEELVPDLKNPDGPLKLCGGIGTVNRLKSEIRSYCDINQRCNVLCHVHNTKDETRQNGELATAAAAAAKKGAAKKGAAEKGAAKKGAGSKEAGSKDATSGGQGWNCSRQRGEEIRPAAECTSLCSSHASLFALGASCGLWLQLGQLGGDMSSLCPTFGGGSRPRHRRKLLP
ncbi:hypothetical protein QJQ45_027464, partial [Haematococcus lacustris]